MKILFSTIVLDGMPFLPLIYAELRKLPNEIEWQWAAMEGVAYSKHCTRWVANESPRLSGDGTTQFLQQLSSFDPRVKHIAKPAWDGKIEMVNAPLTRHVPRSEFLLWEIDCDEIWTADQIVKMRQMFIDNPDKNTALFWCRYFVGRDKVIITRECFGNYPEYEWRRVWKIKPGMVFKTHEPPVIKGLKLNPFTHEETDAQGLVFDHMAYCSRAQVQFKERFYAGPRNKNAAAYAGLTERWSKFQTETSWPRSLKEVMPWAEERCMVDKI